MGLCDRVLIREACKYLDGLRYALREGNSTAWARAIPARALRLAHGARERPCAAMQPIVISTAASPRPTGSGPTGSTTSSRRPANAERAASLRRASAAGRLPEWAVRPRRKRTRSIRRRPASSVILWPRSIISKAPSLARQRSKAWFCVREPSSPTCAESGMRSKEVNGLDEKSSLHFCQSAPKWPLFPARIARLNQRHALHLPSMARSSLHAQKGPDRPPTT